ncbi:MAG: plastocyanin/azurin family copper-binding protein [Solirubrobacteraceae bacterium]
MRLRALLLAGVVALAAAPAADAKKPRGCKKRACRGMVAKASAARGLPTGWATRGVYPRRRGTPTSPGSPTAPGTPTTPGSEPPPPPPPPPIPGSSPWFLQVSSDDTDLEDMHLYLSRGTVRAGEVTVEFNNRAAQDPHNLRLRRGGAVFGFGTVEKGEADEKAFALTVGTYTLFCSLAGHEAAGMKAQLVVAD